MPRLAAFFAYLGDLARCFDYRLLSSVRMQCEEDEAGNDQVNALVNRITRDYAQPLSAAEMAAELGMSESRFSEDGNFKPQLGSIRPNRSRSSSSRHPAGHTILPPERWH